MADPSELLDRLHGRAVKDLSRPSARNEEVLARIDYVCCCPSNRAGVRLLMSCMLAKLDRPGIDPRKPYTEIGSDDCFSGRTYDEQHLTQFISTHRLPCNSTTAFLTPALRNINRPLTTDALPVGRPAQVYSDALNLLKDVAEGRASAEDVLTDAIRILITMRDDRKTKLKDLVAAIERGKDALPLASEAIVRLIEQHLACKNASRLPVLVVTAAYQAAADKLGEVVLPLKSHTAADEQTGAMGDVEVCLANDDNVVTIYEMKMKRVTVDDINRALQKIVPKNHHIDNYVFITTDVIEESIREYAATMYEKTSGTEIIVLDCIGFLRHFLHLFHRLRTAFLGAYQSLVLAEPDSAVGYPLKEAFLSLRQAAESDE